jgi:hypothetical protein
MDLICCRWTRRLANTRLNTAPTLNHYTEEILNDLLILNDLVIERSAHDSIVGNVALSKRGKLKLASEQSHRFVQVRLIGELESITKRGTCAPAQSGKAADVEQFARRAVGP